MSNINKRWQKWVFSSVSESFVNLATIESVPMFLEGQKRKTNELTEWLEFRMDGIWTSEISNRCFKLEMEVNIGVNSTMDDLNFHRHHILLGKAESLFLDCIPIFKYPTDGIVDPQSDSTLFINLALQNMDNSNRLISSFFGQVKPEIEMQQSTVEAKYSQIFSTP